MLGTAPTGERRDRHSRTVQELLELQDARVRSTQLVIATK